MSLFVCYDVLISFASRFSGEIFGITTTAGTISGIISPVVVGLLTQNVSTLPPVKHTLASIQSFFSPFIYTILQCNKKKASYFSPVYSLYLMIK